MLLCSQSQFLAYMIFIERIVIMSNFHNWFSMWYFFLCLCMAYAVIWFHLRWFMIYLILTWLAYFVFNLVNCYVNYVIITELVHRAKGCGCSAEIESGDKERADKESVDKERNKERDKERADKESR